MNVLRIRNELRNGNFTMNASERLEKTSSPPRGEFPQGNEAPLPFPAKVCRLSGLRLPDPDPARSAPEKRDPRFPPVPQSVLSEHPDADQQHGTSEKRNQMLRAESLSLNTAFSQRRGFGNTDVSKSLPPRFSPVRKRREAVRKKLQTVTGM